MLPPDACLSSAVGRLCGCHCPVIPAALSLSVILDHNHIEAGMARWWGEEGGSSACIPSAVRVQHQLCTLSLLRYSRSLSPVRRLQCMLEYGHCCSSLRCVLLFLLVFAAGTVIFEPEQPHKQIIKLFFFPAQKLICLCWMNCCNLSVTLERIPLYFALQIIHMSWHKVLIWVQYATFGTVCGSLQSTIACMCLGSIIFIEKREATWWVNP